MALLTLAANLLPSLLLIAALWYFSISVYLLGIIAVLLFFLSLYSVSTVWRQAQYQFRSLHNLLDAIVLGDYSFRGSHKAGDGAFGELVTTINALARTLQRQRLQSAESQLLVQKVVDQIDVAIIAWDRNRIIRMINPAGRRLLGLADTDTDKLDAKPVRLPESLSFVTTMDLRNTEVHDLQFNDRPGRYRVYLDCFLAEGNPHHLLFLTDVSSILRLEEKRAWRNLVRVLSHEINNTLAPLKSFSDTVIRQVKKREANDDLKREIIDSMTIIGKRADSIANFVQSYHEIARLPEPDKKSTDIAELMTGLVKLFPETTIKANGQSLKVALDSNQVEQVLINLIKNAIEATQTEAEIEVNWRQAGSRMVLTVTDQGDGIDNEENLFTPYYSTKPQGSGIGLVFCQQVVEAHDGVLSLHNRDDGLRGCVARLELPLQ
ncbi:MAG: ATP-binding protein [Pseudomonadales bacterium]|nr:ATP-binding protein [Pseudomonadales bacterium]